MAPADAACYNGGNTYGREAADIITSGDGMPTILEDYIAKHPGSAQGKFISSYMVA